MQTLALLSSWEESSAEGLLWIPSLLSLGLVVLQIWMLVHAVWRGNWLWLIPLLLAPGLGALLYFFAVFWQTPGGHGFELPGAADRRRIKQLRTQIHNVDKAVFHAQLGDIFFEQGKFAKAEECYRAALKREAGDSDTQSHLGQSLLRQGKTAEALPLLRAVVEKDPRHEYGYTLMAYAEALTANGQSVEARAAWEKVVAANTYARARVQLAALLIAQSQSADAKALLDETIADAAHTPAFQRKRERVWIRKAKRLRRRL